MKPAIENQWHRLSVRVLTLVVMGAVVFEASSARAATEAARVVKYAKEDIVPVRAKLRFSTPIRLTTALCQVPGLASKHPGSMIRPFGSCLGFLTSQRCPACWTG